MKSSSVLAPPDLIGRMDDYARSNRSGLFKLSSFEDFNLSVNKANMKLKVSAMMAVINQFVVLRSFFFYSHSLYKTELVLPLHAGISIQSQDSSM